MPRGPSTRTAPAVLATGVGARQAVRVVAVRMDGSVARVDVVHSTGAQAARRAIAAAQADPAVVAVEVDHRVHLDDTVVGTPVIADPFRSQQWALTALRAEDLWRVGTGAGQIVGVVDGGVDASHPDLAGQVLPGTDVVAPGGDGRTDTFGHGTHVAGIIAAVAGNGIGVEGLAPQARILPVRAMDGDSGWDSDIAKGVIWAVDHGAGVVNLSLGGPDASDLVRSAILYATGHAVVVAAVGNERTDRNPIEYPAGFSIPGLIAVAATTSSGVSADYSNSGPQVMIAAPGTSIVSTYPNGRYEPMSGTSMATPYVSAAAAVIRSVDPSLTPAQVARVLVSTADDLEAPGRDDDTGAGLVDPVAALCSLGRCPPGASPSPSPTPTASPSSTASPSPTASPTSTASPSPTSTASPSRTAGPVALVVGVGTAAAPVVTGRAAVLTATVRDAAGPVAGAAVCAASGDRSVRAVTDARGVVRLAVAPVRTATWTVTATAAGHTRASAAVVLAVAPRVAVQWRGSRVTVTVTPALGQVVTVWTRGSRGWLRRTHHTVGPHSSGATLAVPSAAGVQISVSAVSGLSAVTVVRP